MNCFRNILHTAQSLVHKDPQPVQEPDNPPAPSPIPSIGKDNQIMMDSLTKAKKVAVTLGKLGHRVLDISIGGRNARLTISSSSRCHMLGGITIKIVRMHGFEEKTMAASIDGVQVEWTTTSKSR